MKHIEIINLVYCTLMYSGATKQWYMYHEITPITEHILVPLIAIVINTLTLLYIQQHNRKILNRVL